MLEVVLKPTGVELGPIERHWNLGECAQRPDRRAAR
jgi:hypothetical protein